MDRKVDLKKKSTFLLRAPERNDVILCLWAAVKHFQLLVSPLLTHTLLCTSLTLCCHGHGVLCPWQPVASRPRSFLEQLCVCWVFRHVDARISYPSQISSYLNPTSLRVTNVNEKYYMELLRPQRLWLVLRVPHLTAARRTTPWPTGWRMPERWPVPTSLSSCVVTRKTWTQTGRWPF